MDNLSFMTLNFIVLGTRLRLVGAGGRREPKPVGSPELFQPGQMRRRPTSVAFSEELLDRLQKAG